MTPGGDILEAARVTAGLSRRELWLAYYALGGSALPAELDLFLAGGENALPDQDVLSQALNERFLDQGWDSPVPYLEDMA